MLLFVTLHLLLLQGEQTPSKAAEWKRLGLALASEKKLVAAVGPLAKACELDPKDEEACYYFARTLHALGRWDEARACCSRRRFELRRSGCWPGYIARWR